MFLDDVFTLALAVTQIVLHFWLQNYIHTFNYSVYIQYKMCSFR